MNLYNITVYNFFSLMMDHHNDISQRTNVTVKLCQQILNVYLKFNLKFNAKFFRPSEIGLAISCLR